MRNIYVECKPDYTLVKSITTIPKKLITHAGNKSEVCKNLKKLEMCIGRVDEDFQCTAFILCRTGLEDLTSYELKVLHDPSRDNYVIVICPRLEDWILKTAQVTNVDVMKYGLPSDGENLHKRINGNLDRFENLIKDLENCSRVKNLRKLIEK